MRRFSDLALGGLVALTAVAATACAPAAPTDRTPMTPSSTPGIPAPVPLELTGTWVSIATTGPRQVLPSQRVRVSIAPGRFGLHPGCNTHGAGIRVEGQQLVVERMVSTNMACADPQMEQEKWVTQMFTAPVTWAVVDGGDHLRLSRDEQSITFERILDEAPQPTG